MANPNPIFDIRLGLTRGGELHRNFARSEDRLF